MNDSRSNVPAVAFTTADPAAMAARLDIGGIHVWRMRYARHEGREPFRALLGLYLGRPADAVHFVEGAHGRPGLRDRAANLDFNWSHSGDAACMAIARALPELGIDMEAARARPRALELARRFFHPDEAAQLASLPVDQVQSAFLRLWTAKEAVLKALGQGVRYGLDRVPFDLHQGVPTPAVFDGPAGPGDAWNLQMHEDSSGRICLAWRGVPRHVQWFVH